MFNLTAGMTPVLNTDSDQIVMLPLDHASVVRQNALVVIDELNIMGIDDKHYSELVVQLDLDGSGEEVSEAYFVKRCRESAGYDSSVMLYHKGYRHIYKQLRAKHLSLEHILANIPKYIENFGETTADGVLGELEGDYSKLSWEEKQVAAANSLESDWSAKYETTYDVHGNQVMLYSRVA